MAEQRNSGIAWRSTAHPTIWQHIVCAVPLTTRPPPKPSSESAGPGHFAVLYQTPAIRNVFVNMIKEGLLQPYGRLLDQLEAQAAE